MNPKPLESLNHFTLPFGMSCSIPCTYYETNPSPVSGHDHQGRELTATTDAACGGGEGTAHPLLLENPATRNVTQFAQCCLPPLPPRFCVRPPSEESGVLCGGRVAEASRSRPTACLNTSSGTASSPAIQRSRLAACTLSASPSASMPPHHSTARRRVIMGTSEFRIPHPTRPACG